MAMRKRIAGRAKRIEKEEFHKLARGKGEFYRNKAEKMDKESLKELMEEGLEELYEDFDDEDQPNNN